MKLSFIVLTYKTPEHLRVCVSNLQNLEMKYEHEIIVVDNASGDETVDMVKEEFPNVRLIQNDNNLGHPAGNNVGIEASEAEYTVIINPDITIRSGKEIDEILEYMDAHKDVGLLGPRLHNPDGSVQNSVYRKYSKWTPIYRRTFLGKLPFGKKDIARHLMLDFDHNKTIEAEWILGACLFSRQSDVKKLGALSADFFLYFGDYEWADRMRQHGRKVIYYHDTNRIYHYHQRASAAKRFSIQQAFSWATRVHIKDWRTYVRKQKS